VVAVAAFAGDEAVLADFAAAAAAVVEVDLTASHLRVLRSRSRVFCNRIIIVDLVVVAGEMMHVCEGEIVCKSLMDRIPQFNAFMYLENKTQIGKIDEVFGALNNCMFTVKVAEGFPASSFNPGDKFYIAPEKTLALERFLPKPYA